MFAEGTLAEGTLAEGTLAEGIATCCANMIRIPVRLTVT
jgi:hypothetical protein